MLRGYAGKHEQETFRRAELASVLLDGEEHGLSFVTFGSEFLKTQLVGFL